MNGNVFAREARVPVTFRLPSRPALAIEFVVDTGFAGFLTLPLAAVIALNLPWLRDLSANLADDSDVFVSVYLATIVWEGTERNVEVLAMGKRPLLGTLLLDGFRLDAEFNEGGPVRILRP